MAVTWFPSSVLSVKDERLEGMNRELQLVCTFVFCLPLTVVVILMNECYYLCRKDCSESVSLWLILGLNLPCYNSRKPGKINHPPVFFEYSLLYQRAGLKKKKRKGYNLTNTFSALLITLKRVFDVIVVLMRHFASGLRFPHQENFGQNKVLLWLTSLTWGTCTCLSLNLSRNWVVPNLLFSVNKAW